MKITLPKIKKCQTVHDLEGLGIGRVVVEVSHRGGGLGFMGSDVAAAFGVDPSLLSHKYGAGCNYLGGGLRGSIVPSGHSREITGLPAVLLDELAQACVRAYQSVEDEMGLNAETDEAGETNWDAVGTATSRQARIQSAY